MPVAQEEEEEQEEDGAGKQWLFMHPHLFLSPASPPELWLRTRVRNDDAVSIP